MSVPVQEPCGTLRIFVGRSIVSTVPPSDKN